MVRNGSSRYFSMCRSAVTRTRRFSRNACIRARRKERVRAAGACRGAADGWPLNRVKIIAPIIGDTTTDRATQMMTPDQKDIGFRCHKDLWAAVP